MDFSDGRIASTVEGWRHIASRYIDGVPERNQTEPVFFMIMGLRVSAIGKMKK